MYILQVSLVWDIAKLFLTTRVTEPVQHNEATKVTVPTPNHLSSQAPPKPSKEENEDNHVSDDDQNHSSSEVETQDVLGEIASGLHMTQNLFMPSAGPTYEFQINQVIKLLVNCRTPKNLCNFNVLRLLCSERMDRSFQQRLSSIAMKFGKVLLLYI